MGLEEQLTCLNMLAGADLSSYQYCAVYTSGANTVSLAATAGMNATGILQDEPAASGRAAKVGIFGRTKAKAGAAISAGADVAVQVTTGRVVTAVTGDYVLGTALEAATANGDIISVLLKDSGKDNAEYLSLVAADAYTSKQYYAGLVDTAGKVALPTVAGQRFQGVVLTATAAAGTAHVQISGTCTGHILGTVTMGDKLAVSAAGGFIKALTGYYAGAIALESGTSGDDIDIMLLPSRPVAGAWHCMTFSLAGTVGTATIAEDLEVPVAMTLKRGYGKLQTAPGAGKACTVTIGTETLVISGTATTGEDETWTQALAANTDFDISVVDDGVGADLLITVWLQETEA